MKWRKLPTSPLSGRVDPQAVWVDGEVIVISGDPPAQSSSQQVHTDLAAFNPTTNKWTTLAPMPLQSNQLVLGVVAVATNDRLYAWEEWQHAVNNADGSGTIYSGIDLYIYDPTRDSWTADPAASRLANGSDSNNAPNGVAYSDLDGNEYRCSSDGALVRRVPRSGILGRSGPISESDY